MPMPKAQAERERKASGAWGILPSAFLRYAGNNAAAGSVRQRGADNMTQGAASQYAMKVEKDLTVTMRDGVRISLCVYRPDAPGQFPALFAASPYQWEMDEVPAYPLFLTRETGPVEWYV